MNRRDAEAQRFLNPQDSFSRAQNHLRSSVNFSSAPLRLCGKSQL